MNGLNIVKSYQNRQSTHFYGGFDIVPLGNVFTSHRK